ncbi:MAG: LPP20 family lipoprotein, partial [Methyloceanibacter sp.]
PPSQPAVRQHADASFEKLPTAPPLAPRPGPSDDQYLTATGYGDLTKGPLICQRVADTAARAELAKLIRVTIKEHASDRVRERTGQPLEQDIEVVREELVNELLQEVKIVDRKVDKAAGTCSSTAVMRRSNLIPLSPPAPLPLP